MQKLSSIEILAINIKYYRFKNNLSQEKLVDLLKSSLTYMNQLENGKRNASLNMLDKIAKQFKVEPYRLLQYNPNHIVEYKRIDQKNRPRKK